MTSWADARFEDLILDSQNGCSARGGTGVPEVVLRLSDVSVENGAISAHGLRKIPLPDHVRDKYRLGPGDILVIRVNGSRDLVGRAVECALEHDGYLYCDHFIRVRVNPEATLPEFVCHAFRCSVLRAQIKGAIVSSAGQNTISQSSLKNLAMKIPPLNEQRRIVAKIEALQTRSEAAEKAFDAIGPLLEQFRQSVLAAAFRGDLTASWREQHPDVEPASTLLERIRVQRKARFIAAAGDKARAKAEAKARTAGKPWTEADAAAVVEDARAKAEAQYVEPESVDATGLPELPRGWCWASWGEVGFCQNGRAFPSNEYCDAGTKLLRPGNLFATGEVIWNEQNTRCMPEKWAEEYSDFVVGSSELVINLTAQSLKDEFLGRVCLTTSGERCLLNQRIARLTPVLLDAEFCLWVFKSPAFRGYVDDGLNTGSLIQHIFTTQIANFVFPLPPGPEQGQIVQSVRKALTTKEQLGALVSELAVALPGLNQSILAKAFRGELVPQDPTDEPASVLLERIRAERTTSAALPKKPKLQRAAPKPVLESKPTPPPPKPAAAPDLLVHIPPERVPVEEEPAEVMAALRKLIGNHVGVPRDGMLRALAESLGYQRVSSKLRDRLDGLLRAAVRRRILEPGHAESLRLATHHVEDYSQEDLAATLRTISRRGCVYEREELARSLLDHLGFRRMSATAKQAITSALGAAIKNGIFEEVDSERLRRR